MSAAALEEPVGTVGLMTSGDRQAAEAVQLRRLALGMSVKALAKHAGIDRGRLAALESGHSVRPTTLAAVTRALDEIEEEVSGPYDAEHGVVTFRLKGNFGVDVTLQGPVDNLDELEASVTRLMTSMGRDESDSAQSGNAGT